VSVGRPIRYTFGGDEHLVAEVSEEMSLSAFFTSIAVCNELRRRNLSGVTEICPANSSYLVRFDPDLIGAEQLLAALQDIEQGLDLSNRVLQTRIIEIPVLYNDPWTHETSMRFRERHQDPNSTDIEYASKINHLADVEAFIERHSGAPWLVSMVGFVAGLPFLFQMVERDRQLQVPKYLSPRTDTPKQTLGHGGCFSCIYSVRGAGGYQMFGITPAPVFDPDSRLDYFEGGMVFFKPGDIVKFKPLSREEYDLHLTAVERGTYTLRIAPVTFSLERFLADPVACNGELLGALPHD
jgi:urea carboxylase